MSTKILDDEQAAQSLVDVGSLLARACVSAAAFAGPGLGRLVAVRKLSAGTRGLVVGDFLRRLDAPSWTLPLPSCRSTSTLHTTSSAAKLCHAACRLSRVPTPCSLLHACGTARLPGLSGGKHLSPTSFCKRRVVSGVPR